MLSLDWCLVLVWAHRPCHYLSMAKYEVWFPERSIMKRINIGDVDRVGKLSLLETRSQQVQCVFGECGGNGIKFEGDFDPAVCLP